MGTVIKDFDFDAGASDQVHDAGVVAKNIKGMERAKMKSFMVEGFADRLNGVLCWTKNLRVMGVLEMQRARETLLKQRNSQLNEPLDLYR